MATVHDRLRSNLSVAVLASLGGGHLYNLARTWSEHDKTILPESWTLHGIGGGRPRLCGFELVILVCHGDGPLPEMYTNWLKIAYWGWRIVQMLWRKCFQLGVSSFPPSSYRYRLLQTVKSAIKSNAERERSFSKIRVRIHQTCQKFVCGINKITIFW